ncbi:ZnII2Cys6 transcription factor [Aspergillus sclerotialis]|uniref:ZnII2Cys6 transcription factor n=1 Tax=Aspergillus sclerotialis TaxID=2070753 RepID=A0A3A2ZUK6_9EURO|nr:ZnII2Cys6 transcription factor [Aspergillus sclerotialis]
MDRLVRRPVKAACLSWDRSCVYRPSRRGGSRKRAKDPIGTQRVKKPVSGSSLPSSSSEIQSEAATDIAQPGIPLMAGGQITSAEDPSIQDIQSLPSPFRRIENSILGPDTLWSSYNADLPSKIQGTVMRTYTSDEDIVNAYYHHLHASLPLLPPPIYLHPDEPNSFQPAPEDATAVKLSLLPHEPKTSFTLALSAILVLIPPHRDQGLFEHFSVWLRGSYAQLFAHCALSMAEKEIEEAGLTRTRSDHPVEGRLHPHLPPQLHPVLALVFLSVYEYCHCGNIYRMRIRANQAVTTAMDYSLHQLGGDALEAQRRAWWSAVSLVPFLWTLEALLTGKQVLLMYHSSIVTMSSPIVTIEDPRILTPYPAFHVQLKFPQSWLLAISAEDAYVSVSAIVDPTVARHSYSGRELQDRIRRLDALILTLITKCKAGTALTRSENPEERASQSLDLIACCLMHSARIKLHRFRAFSDIPIFIERHCDLTSLELNGSSLEATSLSTSGLESSFPVTQDESSIACLKSSLAVARVFTTLSSITASVSYNKNSDSTLADSAETAFEVPTVNAARLPVTLPYFKCAGMQACYSLYMLANRIQAALNSNRVSICYPLLSHPDPVTEVQDAERLLEEIWYASHCIILSMKTDMVFGGIASAVRDLDAIHHILFPKPLPNQLI